MAKSQILLSEGGGAFIDLNGTDITIGAPSSVSVKGASHDFMGAASVSAALPALPDTRVKLFDEQIRAINERTGEPIVGLPYKLTTASGDIYYGITDQEGKTIRMPTISAEKIEVVWGVTDPKSAI